MPETKKPTIRSTKKKILITDEGIEGQLVSDSGDDSYGLQFEIPDMLAYIQGKTELTRSTILENRSNFEVVIIDYQMPGISGAETVYRILRYKPEMKILALSNYDELPYIQSMMDAGAKGYVLKNIEPVEMLSAIRTILSDKVYYCNEVAVKSLNQQKTKI